MLICPYYSKYLQATQIPKAKTNLETLTLAIFPYYSSLGSRFSLKGALLPSYMLLYVQLPISVFDYLCSKLTLENDLVYKHF